MNPFSESICIIIGASQWPHYDAFDGNEAFLNGANFLRDYVSSGGISTDRILWLFDDGRQPGDLIIDIRQFLIRFAAPTVRNVLVYYVGHGGYRQREYFLALRCTNKDVAELTTMPVALLAKALAEEAPDKRQIVIVDACYAAAADAAFVLQDGTIDVSSDVSGQLRAYATENVVDRGTAVFCAAGSRAEAKLPVGAQYTMFTGALRQVLNDGAPDLGEFMTLAQVSSLVEGHIRVTFGTSGVRPEVHTPRQEKGDLRDLPFFPNPAYRRHTETADVQRLRAELDGALDELGELKSEAAWERKSRQTGWYELLDLRMDLDQFGDVAQTHRIVQIHGPETGELSTLPYGFAAPPKLGTCVLVRIFNEQLQFSYGSDDLPGPAVKLRGELSLGAPCGAGATHRGFTIESMLTNSFAMTQADARLREHPEVEYALLRPSLAARHMRIALYFPTGYAPMERPRAVAYASTDGVGPASPEDPTETARIAHGFMYDEPKGVAVLNVERAVSGVSYAIRWRVPPRAASDAIGEAARAREQVLRLTNMSAAQVERVNKALGTVVKRICRNRLGWGRSRPKVELSLLVFDEACWAARVVATTMADPVPGSLPWGAGVVGWVMRRRRPAFVDTRDRGTAGIYQKIDGHPDDRYVLCVPISLPADSDRRSEQLRDPSIPCAVAALSCVDETGNMGRLKGDASKDGVSTSLVGAVSSELVDGVLDIIIRESARRDYSG